MRGFLLRRLRGLFDWKFSAALVVVVPYLGWALWHGVRAWWLSWLALAAVAPLLIAVGAYAAHWHNTVGRIRHMQVPMSRFKVDEDELCVASELGSATVPWALIVDIWEFRGLWLLLLSTSYFITLPTDGVPEAALRFIREQVKGVHRV